MKENLPNAFVSTKIFRLTLAIAAFICAGCPNSAAENQQATDIQTEQFQTLGSAKKEEQKWYQDMTDGERLDFVAKESNRILHVIGSSESSISSADVAVIKEFVDSYAKRSDNKTIEFGCSAKNVFKTNLSTVLWRGQKSAPLISSTFKQQGISSLLGIYTAMIESEFCPCLQSPIGSVGMFQILKSQANEDGLKVSEGASTSETDERCRTETASRFAAVHYRKTIEKAFLNEPNSATFAIAAYNAGEGMTKKNIRIVRELTGEENVSFWTLRANQDKLSKQFQLENQKYVPKFLAAAIVGENPSVFGEVEYNPLSESAATDK